MLTLTPTDRPAESIMPPIDQGLGDTLGSAPRISTRRGLSGVGGGGERERRKKTTEGRDFTESSSSSSSSTAGCHMLHKPFKACTASHKLRLVQ